MASYSQTISLQREDNLLFAEFSMVIASLEELVANVDTFLHAKEMDYFATLTYELRQQSYLLGRYAKKLALSRYLNGVPLNKILIEEGVFNFPIVSYAAKSNINVSDSHSGSCGIAIAFSEKHPMGIDIELIDVNKIDVIQSQLTQEEKHLIQTTSNVSEEVLCALFWTAKESLSKVLRTGLTTPFQIYQLVNLVNKENHWMSEFKNFSQYQAISFLLEDFVCSIVYPRRTTISIEMNEIQKWYKKMKYE